MLLPIGHENMETRRWPVITIALIVLNVLAFLATYGTLQHEPPEVSGLRYRIRLLCATHPELTEPPVAQRLVDDIRRTDPTAWEAVRNQKSDALDLFRAQSADDSSALQAQMNQLCTRYDELQQNSLLARWAFVPAHPTAYSYITASFLNGGWLQLICNMWFLWLAGMVLEDAWGRPLYLLIYLLAGAFSLAMQGVFNASSTAPTLGAPGAVAALMGAFLVRFPNVRIQMAMLYFVRIVRFTAAAYWLLPAWFLLELFYGTVLGANNGGVAHTVTIGGFLFGMAAAIVIHITGLEHAIGERIGRQLDPERHGDLDAIEGLIRVNRTVEAADQLRNFLAQHPDSERALLMIQSVHLSDQRLADYGKVTEHLCMIHLGQHELPTALKDYRDLVESGAGLPSAETWMKLCQAMEEQQEFERAAGEYMELAEAYPENRHSLLALMAAARLAMSKLGRPQQALAIFEAVASSKLPHLDLDGAIQAGIRNAQAAVESNPSAAQ
ncbi:MAG: rhomboid family intramembrane serine protease [Acidobacteriota bacterium]|nr:rhomboid family intramembrane serine protease [Acidobacteriota bacterium]